MEENRKVDDLEEQLVEIVNSEEDKIPEPLARKNEAKT